jgi:hypothetical protein
MGLADDAHEPVLNLLPKKNREFSYASAKRQAGHVRIKLGDD